MPYGVEVTTIVGAVIALMIAIFVLRLSNFTKETERLEGELQTNKESLNKILVTEIGLGKKADVEEVVNLVNRMSSMDSMIGDLDAIDRSMTRGFMVDMGVIAILVMVAVLSVTETVFDPISILFIYLAVMAVFVDVNNFTVSVRSLFKIRNKLRADKKKK